MKYSLAWELKEALWPNRLCLKLSELSGLNAATNEEIWCSSWWSVATTLIVEMKSDV